MKDRETERGIIVEKSVGWDIILYKKLLKIISFIPYEMLEVPLVFSIPFLLLEGGRRLSKLTKVIGETYLQCWLDWKESRIKTTFKLIETTKTNGKQLIFSKFKFCL
uniref:Uncharacterized protein n=1 Tax=Cacopsylla melanoneura TaxID=428564 RepID=A0A8D8SRW0_9HEMI